MSYRERLVLCGYVAVINVALPLGILLALPFLFLKEKRRKTVFRRLGFQRYPMPAEGLRPLWVHALSLGELLSCTTLIQQLRQRLPDRPIYFSVSTFSAMQIAQDRIRPNVDGLFYFPFDLWWPARRALRRLNPALMVVVETDIWPGFQRRLRAEHVPAVLVNGRLSPESFHAATRYRSLFRPALNTFETIHPQSAAEGQRYREVGVEPNRVASPGNLKFDVAATAPTSAELQALRGRLRLRAEDVVLLAGSTHPGEEEAVLEAFRIARGRIPTARLILVPRHPARGDDVCTLAHARGWRVHRYTAEPVTDPYDVFVVDAIGVLAKLYHVSSVAFVGGSLVPKGGQNPLEAAAAGCPVLFGPDMKDFPDIAAWLIDHQAAVEVTSGQALGEAWAELLLNKVRCEQMGRAGQRVVDENRGATRMIVEELLTRIDQ